MEQRYEQLQMVLDEMGLTIEATEMELHQMENVQACLEVLIQETSAVLVDGEIPDILEALDTLKGLYTALHFIHHLIHDHHVRAADGHPTEEEEGEKPMSEEALLADYGKWVGHCSMKAANVGQLTPKTYIEEFCDMSWTLTYKEAYNFLKNFHTEEAVRYWMESYEWREDPDDKAFEALGKI